MRRLFLFLTFLPLLLSAQNDKTLSPYFELTGDSLEPGKFPLRHTSADVNIAGVIADVTVTQVYINESARPLEAVYIFPMSTRAAVYAMEMQVGRRHIEAQIREKSAARAEYIAAKQEGKTASLLEQERPNVFKMNVANVMPGDSIVVQLSYTELLVPENGVYEFVYPTVVAPRYAGLQGLTASLTDELPAQPKGMPYTKAGIPPAFDFDIRVRAESPVPFEWIESSSHKVQLSFEEKNAANILLSPEEKLGANRDYMLRYKLSGPAIKTGMMTYEGKDENFFLFMMQPPARVAPEEIPPREYIFVMDVSGSMGGFPIETSKALLRNLILGLRPGDLFNVVEFAGDSEKFSDTSVKASRLNVERALKFIDKEAGGGTELRAAMETAMAIPAQEGYSRTLVVVTDGLITAEADVLQSIHNRLDSANVFTFGIGTSVNRYLIEGIAYAGKGEPAVVERSQDADAAAEKFRAYISSPVLTHINVDFGGMDVYDVEPVADLFADRPIVVWGKYRGSPGGDITVTGVSGKKPYKAVVPVADAKPKKKNKALRYLWARERVRLLDYEDTFSGRRRPEIGKEITRLGLEYNLMTHYTSFIAVYGKVRNKDGSDSTIIQPSPMPQGVPNSAVGYAGNINNVNVITGGIPAAFGNVLSGVVNISCCKSVMCEAVEIVSTVPLTNIDCRISPICSYTKELTGHHYGGMPATGFTFESYPFFSPQFSSRIAGSIPYSWIGSYSSFGSGAAIRSEVFAPDRQGNFTFAAVPYENTLSLSATSYGQSALDFTWKKETPGQRFRFGTRVNAIRTPQGVDRNEDGFMDIAGHSGISLAQVVSYSNYEKRLRYVINTTYVHGSFSNGGQTTAGTLPLFTTSDSLFALCNRTAAHVELDHRLDLYTFATFGWASRTVRYGNTDYSSAAPFGWARASLDYTPGGYHELEVSLSAAYFGGDEKLDEQVFSFGRTSFTGAAEYRYNKRSISLQPGLQVHHDSRFGSWITPVLKAGWNFRDIFASLSARRIRGQEMSAGANLPLLYSARALTLAQQLPADDGWYGIISVAKRKNFGSTYLHVEAKWSGTIYNRLTLTDLDSRPGEVFVYAAGPQPLQHRAIADVRASFRKRWQANAQYLYTFRPVKYQAGTFLHPLLPQHQVIAKLVRTFGVRDRWTLALAGQYSSRQRLPGHGFSEDYATADLSVQHKYKRWTMYAQVYNIFNYRQPVAVYGAQDPWSSTFDASMSWAPVIGRNFQVGASYRFGGEKLGER